MNTSMFRSVAVFILAFSTLSTRPAIGQEVYRDVVYLKNGSIIRGTIVELIPNTIVKIQTADKSLFVYQMEDVERIAKESVSDSPDAVHPSMNAMDRRVIGANPLGAIIGGVSWLSYEKYFGENLTYQIRGDLWTYSETENDRGYYYHEKQSGVGAGGSLRTYLANSRSYSGLFGAAGLDMVYTGWTWEERATSYSSTYTGDGNTLTMILNVQIGFGIAVSNVRIEPSIVAGYFALREKGAGVAGVFVAPSVQAGVVF